MHICVFLVPLISRALWLTTALCQFTHNTNKNNHIISGNNNIQAKKALLSVLVSVLANIQIQVLE